MVWDLKTLHNMNLKHPKQPRVPKRSHKRKVKETPNPRHVALAKSNRPWTVGEIKEANHAPGERAVYMQFATAAKSGGQEGIRA
jgi:hypothetical protein